MPPSYLLQELPSTSLTRIFAVKSSCPPYFSFPVNRDFTSAWTSQPPHYPVQVLEWVTVGGGAGE